MHKNILSKGKTKKGSKAILVIESVLKLILGRVKLNIWTEETKWEELLLSKL